MNTAKEFEVFFTEYQQINKTQKQQLLGDMVNFFESYKAALKKYSTRPLDIERRVPRFTEEQYATFFSTFKPLYVAQKRRGAEINVWSESGLKRDEVRNTSVLAWWLDANGSHGLGNVLFKALLNTLPQADFVPISSIERNYWVKTESLPMGERENRIDIEVYGSDFLVFIEVKIDAGEGCEQLNRYQELIKKKVDSYGICYGGIIYLTRYSSPKNKKTGCINISWKDIANSFREAELPVEAGFTQRLLMQFCSHIENF